MHLHFPTRKPGRVSVQYACTEVSCVAYMKITIVITFASAKDGASNVETKVEQNSVSDNTGQLIEVGDTVQGTMMMMIMIVFNGKRGKASSAFVGHRTC